MYSERRSFYNWLNWKEGTNINITKLYDTGMYPGTGTKMEATDEILMDKTEVQVPVCNKLKIIL
jgi:hypothetical protein